MVARYGADIMNYNQKRNAQCIQYCQQNYSYEGCLTDVLKITNSMTS